MDTWQEWQQEQCEGVTWDILEGGTKGEGRDTPRKDERRRGKNAVGKRRKKKKKKRKKKKVN